MIEAIVFDKDGTLFDFQATWAAPFRTFLEILAPDEETRTKASDVLGYDLTACSFRPESIAIAGTSGEIAAALAPVLNKATGDILAALDRVGSNARQVPSADLLPCLTSLRRFGPLGLVTNDSEAPARVHLSEAGVLEIFDFIAGFDSGYGAKPEPGQLLGFAAAMDVQPAATLMVGDSRHDLMAANAAGMVPVGVLTGVADERELAPLAEVVLPDISHLEAWIQTQSS